MIKMTEDSIIFETPKIDLIDVSINGVAYNNPVSITWSWGDGSTTTSWFPASHIYLLPGKYTITATANYSDGSTASTSTTISISILFDLMIGIVGVLGIVGTILLLSKK